MFFCAVELEEVSVDVGGDFFAFLGDVRGDADVEEGCLARWSFGGFRDFV